MHTIGLWISYVVLFIGLIHLILKVISLLYPPAQPSPKNTNEYNVKVTVSVQLTSFFENGFTNISSHLFDHLDDAFRNKAVLILDLVSADDDKDQPKEGTQKIILKGKTCTEVKDKPPKSQAIKLVKYVDYIKVKADFGEVGAVLVENEHRNEIHIIDILLEGLPSGPLQISCNSWVHPKSKSSQKRVFFTNKSYLPSQTPNGLKKLREEELKNLRGDGKGKRESFERIYDYDIYDDLGERDKCSPLHRKSLGGTKTLPYPRRCRTGCDIKRSGLESVYVPRDERFSALKQEEFGFSALFSRLHSVIPPLWEKFYNRDKGFPYMTAINLLFNEAIKCPDIAHHRKKESLLPEIIRDVSDAADKALRFELPQTFQRDGFSWFKDEEFARQTLAGMNPLSIKCLQKIKVDQNEEKNGVYKKKNYDCLMKSKLDINTYGPQESALTKTLVNEELKGDMTVDQALKEKRLFVIDYHDAFLPYVNKVSELTGRTLYGSRTLFFYDGESLKPLAIELTRPPCNGEPQWKQVYKPRTGSTSGWLWKLAKAHVLAHDSSYHQLISHWLRTHCCTEPYIIAANRQLSAMHPIYRLLHPHFRYTMEINALARKSLINANGIIENTFSPGKYSLELSSTLYGSDWRFDHEALPADLISRGMAVKDPSNKEHGIRLIIDDYPYAKDGLELWSCIKHWITDYVSHYYPVTSLVESDKELQAWWTEIRTVGHGDKKDETWWPALKTPEDLIKIITTIIWVTSGHHAAVNFGQYAYAGYFPNRPTITRTKMPTEYPIEGDKWKLFIESPEKALLECFPTQNQAATVMFVLDVLSSHSSEEEYLGQDIKPSWKAEPEIEKAFNKFHDDLKVLDDSITGRNNDENLMHRHGAGVVPYDLLRPVSTDYGVTGMGVPNSISI